MATTKRVFGISTENVKETFPVEFDHSMRDGKFVKKGEILCVKMNIVIYGNLLDDIFNVNTRPIHEDGMMGVIHSVSSGLLHFQRERDRLITVYKGTPDYAAYLQRGGPTP